MTDKTPVTLLHEVLHKKKLVPTYNLIKNGVGTHKPEFEYEVVVEDKLASGSGRSKKEAQHAAAQNMLKVLLNTNEEIIEEVSSAVIKSPYEEVSKDNYVGMLQDFCCRNNLPVPEYTLTREEGLSHAKIFCYKVAVSCLSEQAEARTKKQAKQQASYKLLQALKQNFEGLEEPIPVFETKFEEQIQLVKTKLKEKEDEFKRPEVYGCCIADYYKAFQVPHAPKSMFLESLKEKSNTELEVMRQDCMRHVKKILEELGADYEMEKLSSEKNKDEAVVLTLYTLPKWTFLGLGVTERDAQLNAFDQAFNFMFTLSG